METYLHGQPGTCCSGVGLLVRVHQSSPSLVCAGKEGSVRGCSPKPSKVRPLVALRFSVHSSLVLVWLCISVGGVVALWDQLLAVRLSTCEVHTVLRVWRYIKFGASWIWHATRSEDASSRKGAQVEDLYKSGGKPIESQ